MSEVNSVVDNAREDGLTGRTPVPIVAGSHEEAPRSSADTLRTPIAGTRGAARRYGEPPRERTFAAQRVARWDGSRLGYRFAKRTFDIAFSLIVLALLLVPGAVLCLIIAIDSPGGPFYGQERLGKMGPDGRPRPFRMWKFRSMCKDADKQLDSLLDRNEVDGAMFKMHDDPRVTRVGRFMRKHSIDEFPQFLNVLLGDMSVVGPRPPLPREVEQYDEWAMQRLAVKPGLTGPWQVGGRSDLDFDDMVRLDLGYIAKRSVRTDLVLIIQTVKVVFTGSGAA